MELLFPYGSIRAHQDELVKAVLEVCEKRKHLLVHAPTGLGKTAGALAPALTIALRDNLTVFFLTARHTQHMLALQTLHDIEKKHGKRIAVLDLIGKKWLCLQPGVERLHSGEFVEFCRALREDGRCTYYENLKVKGDISPRTLTALSDLAASDSSTKSILSIGRKNAVCPYEVAILHGREAKLVIADYSYIFNEGIREPFLKKIGKELGQCIVIVDEAHNLPERIKDLASAKLSTYIVKRARQEALKYEIDAEDMLNQLETFLNHGGTESFLEKEEIEVDDEVIEELQKVGDRIREEQRSSFLGSIADFLRAWKVEREGFARIYSPDYGGRDASVAYRCLDAGIITAPVFEQVAASIVMSGTLTPTQMYTEIMDLPVGTREITLPSPFPEENRLVLVVPRTTTKYTGRSPEMYVQIGTMVAEMANRIPGNSIAFFPSYDILNAVKMTLTTKIKRTVFEETPGLSKEDREQLLERFKGHKDTGAVMLAVTAGSFGEGVDLPGDLLKAVIIVGIPLQRPTKEVEALIAYYDKKYGRGWDYGYMVPAFNKVLQGAGRAIRTMTDRGAIIFLDERFSLPQYQRLFPPEWNVKTTLVWHKPLEAFFAGEPAEKRGLTPEFITEEQAVAEAKAKAIAKKEDSLFSSGDKL